MLHLRAIEDGDLPLLRAWLNREHVKKWFELPERNIYSADWLYEVERRFDEFSWLTHLIIESDGRPIGFCVYYDCFDAKEDWYGPTAKGEAYGIDYLIGEPDFVGKGFGKETVRLLIKKIKSETRAARIVAQPDPENHASRAVLKANGFMPDQNKGCFELRLNRPFDRPTQAQR
jgi:RimJ/RimL family protein N-acetyltransferase